MTEELTVEEYQAAKEQLGTALLDHLDGHAARMAFNVLSAFDLPHGVKGYLYHARTLGEVSLIWALAQGYVELTEKGKENLPEAEDGEETFGVPGPEGNVIPLFPNGGQYL